MTSIHTIKTAAEHGAALARIDRLMDAAEGMEEIAELEALAILVERYERDVFPTAPPSLIDVIRLRMEQMG